MRQSIVRMIFRWIHIVFSVPILGYIYSPFEEIPKYAPAVRRIFVPVIVGFGIVDVERPSSSAVYSATISPAKRNCVSAGRK